MMSMRQRDDFYWPLIFTDQTRMDFSSIKIKSVFHPCSSVAKKNSIDVWSEYRPVLMFGRSTDKLRAFVVNFDCAGVLYSGLLLVIAFLCWPVGVFAQAGDSLFT